MYRFLQSKEVFSIKELFHDKAQCNVSLETLWRALQSSTIAPSGSLEIVQWTKAFAIVKSLS